SLLAAFTHSPGNWEATQPYLVLPALIVVAVRLGVRSTALAVAATAQVATIGAALGHGTFVSDAPTSTAFTAVQLFLAVAGTTSLLIAVVVEDSKARDSVERSLRRRALHDPLTGLPNRQQLVEHLSERL